MKEVSRAAFAAFVRAHPELIDHPVEAKSRCVMQYVTTEFELAAQAIYVGGLEPRYMIREGA